ncbi:unnamed protein product [Blepharisma stoltei]|uniref:Tetratricopeptide repeat protein n=1 Tax=Blepharisma stoltei TaxID=1481888 RepID=A0AAU9J3I9_9CILI|nr:unnamed protein product [Blepharisma stoltei]
MQNTPEMYNKASKPTSIESANVKNSISLIINENRESLKEPENAKKPIKKSPGKEKSLLNSQISTPTNDLNNKPKETESALNLIDTLRNKRAEILSRANNPELEIDFRATCSAIQVDSTLYDPPLMQAYQAYINAHQQKTCLYTITENVDNNRNNLIIYNTETETEEAEFLELPESVDWGTCIAQIPNGKLFCFGKANPVSGITVLIDMNGGIEVLPSGTPCYWSSCIYFNSCVYCFGGLNDYDYLNLSSRFDFDRNRWIQLAPMPQADYCCNTIIFNRNILISGWKNRKLLLYSIDIDSFSTIPYKFEKENRKILINAERLYLIECRGSIYESEIGSYSNWRRIRKSAISYDPGQVYCSYNKAGICISTIYGSFREYYYFNLNQKIIIEVAYYNEHVSLRRVGKKIEVKKWNNQNFKLDPYYQDEWNLKDVALRVLGENLEIIERLDEKIKLNPSKIKYYDKKGSAFYRLGRYLEAIKCYDKAIKLNPYNAGFYNDKGKAFNSLGRYLEALECYDEAIKLIPNSAGFYNDKGNSFYSLGRYLEALECYDEAIKLNPNDDDFYWKKGYALNKLGRYPEAVESYDEAIKLNPNNVKFYNRKGNTLYALERYQEAKQCYDKALKLEPNNPLHFCNRARVFNNLRQEDAALQDFNKAYNLMQENQLSDAFTEDEWKFSQKDINFINDVLGRDRIELFQKLQI